MENQQPSQSATDSDTTQGPNSLGNEPELSTAELAKMVAEKRREAGIEIDGGLQRLKPPPPDRYIPPAETPEAHARREAADLRWRQDEERERNEDRHRAWSNLIGLRGVRYNDCRLSTFKTSDSSQKAAIERLTEYGLDIRENFQAGRCIVWFGPPGTGKDHLLMAMARIAIANDYRVGWKNGAMLWAEFRATMDDDSDRNEIALLKQLTAPDILAISDPLPPVGKLSEYQITSLCNVIDARYSHLKPTWLTLNVANRREAEDRMSPQVVRRIADGSLVIVCNWPPFKQETAQ